MAPWPGSAGSAYPGLAGQYLRGASPAMIKRSAFFDSSAPPKNSPTGATLGAEVAKVLNGGVLVTNAIYSDDTNNDGANNYCVLHVSTTLASTPVQVAYVANTSGDAGCDPGNLTGSTVSEGTRSVADSTAHEIMEAITDASPHRLDRCRWIRESDACETATEAAVSLTHAPGHPQPEWSDACGE